MEIVVDSRFKLVTDRTGWEVVQYRPASKGPNAGKPGWYSEGHFDTLPWALRGCFRLMLHEGRGMATLEQLAQRVEKAESRLLRAVEVYSQPQEERQVRKSPSGVVPRMSPGLRMPERPEGDEQIHARPAARRGR